MSAFSETVLSLGSNVLAYWPLEAGSGADAGPNANKEALTVTGSPAEGPALVAGGGASMVHDGSTVSLAAAVPASGAGSQLNLTTAFSIFGWVAPSSITLAVNPSPLFGRESQWSIGMAKTLGTPLFSVTPATGLNLGTGVENMAICPQASGAWTGTPWPYFLCLTWDGAEFVSYINGRYSRQALGAPTFAKVTTPFTVNPNTHPFAGSVGHIGVINGALPAGVVRSLFLAGYIGQPPPFTDVFSYQADGIPALAQITPGVPSTVTVPGSPVVAVAAAAVQQSAKKASVVGYCAAPSCGGAIRANEHYVMRTYAVGGAQPIHRSCYRVRTMNKAQPTSPASKTEIIEACSRLMMDMTAQSTIKTTDSKKRYLRINEGPLQNGASAGSFRLLGTGEESYSIMSGIAPAMATLQRYYDLPKDSWCRSIAELVIDQVVAQRQWLTETIAGGQNAYGAIVDDLTVLPSTSSLNSANNDFYYRDLPQTLLLLWPWLSVTKRKAWTKSLVAFSEFMVGDRYTGGIPGAYFYINGNRNAQTVLGLWMTWLVTGEAKWRQHYELAWKFLVEPAVLTPEGKTPSMEPINKAIWGDANNLALGGSNAAQPFGAVTTTAGTQADGSDSVGYLGESTGSGSAAPNGLIGPGFDGDYSQYQLEILHELYLWSGDPRALRLANTIYNTLLTKVDKVGGKIPYRKPAIGSALGPVTSVASEIASGVTSIPANLTSGMAFAAGAKLQVGEGTAGEELTIAAGGVALGEPGSLTTTTATTKSHAAGVLLAETTASNPFYGPWTYDAQQGSRHNTILLFGNPFGFLTNWRGLRAANPVSAEDVKGQWAAIDTFYRTQVQSGASLGAALNFRDMGHKLAVLLQSDPAFSLPTKPGA